MNIYLFATKRMYQHIQQKWCNVRANTNLSNLVFVRKKNGSAMVLLTKNTKIQDLRDRSSMSSKFMEQILLGFVVMVVLCKGGDFDLLLITCQPLVSPAEITELAFDLLSILLATDGSIAAFQILVSFRSLCEIFTIK